MIELAPERIAAEARAEVAVTGADGRAVRAVIDSREVGPGDLFFGLRGDHVDGGAHAQGALEAGAWGVVVGRDHAARLADEGVEGWVFAAGDPLRALQRVARAWRRALDCRVVGVTGSTGKTSVKDITHAILPLRVHASPANFNTEVGLPLAILAAEPETEVLVLEMAMRGLGQIAELCEIAEPDVAAITNVGPVHLELLGTLEAIAEAKAEILTGLRPGGHAVIPADAEALEPHLEERLATTTFGPGGDVFALASHGVDGGLEARIATPEGEQVFRFPFNEAHNLTNAICAIGIGRALGVSPAEMARRAPGITFSRLRGERIELAGETVLVNDCYNANPISMRAALDHLATGLEPRGEGRRVAVLGEMAELGPQAGGFHREIGAQVRRLDIGPIVGVGELARDYAPDAWVATAEQAVPVVERMLRPGDVILVKGSRSVGLELLSDELIARRGAGEGPDSPEPS